jgi:hypothetical protein
MVPEMDQITNEEVFLGFENDDCLEADKVYRIVDCTDKTPVYMGAGERRRNMQALCICTY